MPFPDMMHVHVAVEMTDSLLHLFSDYLKGEID
jgi:hypothetical protein